MKGLNKKCYYKDLLFQEKLQLCMKEIFLAPFSFIENGCLCRFDNGFFFQPRSNLGLESGSEVFTWFFIGVLVIVIQFEDSLQD